MDKSFELKVEIDEKSFDATHSEESITLRKHKKVEFIFNTTAPRVDIQTYRYNIKVQTYRQPKGESNSA